VEHTTPKWLRAGSAGGVVLTQISFTNSLDAGR
jgi:hypothetical protein